MENLTNEETTLTHASISQYIQHGNAVTQRGHACFQPCGSLYGLYLPRHRAAVVTRLAPPVKSAMRKASQSLSIIVGAAIFNGLLDLVFPFQLRAIQNASL